MAEYLTVDPLHKHIVRERQRKTVGLQNRIRVRWIIRSDLLTLCTTQSEKSTGVIIFNDANRLSSLSIFGSVAYDKECLFQKTGLEFGLTYFTLVFLHGPLSVNIDEMFRLLHTGLNGTSHTFNFSIQSMPKITSVDLINICPISFYDRHLFRIRFRSTIFEAFLTIRFTDFWFANAGPRCSWNYCDIWSQIYLLTNCHILIAINFRLDVRSFSPLINWTVFESVWRILYQGENTGSSLSYGRFCCNHCICVAWKSSP